MSPTFAYGRNRRLYRYYVSTDLQKGRSRQERERANPAPRRISADALETLLDRSLKRLLPDAPDACMSLVSRVAVHRTHLDLSLPLRLLRSVRPNLAEGETADPDPADRTRLRLILPARLRIRSGKSEFLAGAPDAPKPDPVLIRALRNAHAMLDLGADGSPILAAAPASPYRRRLVRLAFLAPDLQRAILDGRQPRHMTLAALMEQDLPLRWVEQQRIFGRSKRS